MRSKNISFGEVIRSKQRSPQLQLKKKSMKLGDLMKQWENDPENNYTLYLGLNQYSTRSQFSASRMLTSSNRNNSTHFDNWIENQKNPYTIEIDNSQGYRGNKFLHGSRKTNYNSNTHQSNKSPKTMGDLVRKNKQAYHIQNSSQFANSVGNVQMIKSKTCQTYEKKNIPVKQPSSRPELVTNHIQFEQPHMKEVKKNKNKFFTNITQQTNEVKKDMKFKSLLQNKKKEESIEQLVQNTKYNITNQIAQLALKYADDEQYREQTSQIMSSRVHDDEQQQEDQLLIGDSDKKPLTNEEPLFSESYQEKARKAQQLDRLRKEEAKNRINDLMKNYKPLKKNDQIFKIPEINFAQFQQKKEQTSQDNYQVGYSFASNQPEQLKKQQKIQRQDNLYQNIEYYQNEKPINLQISQQFQFKQKYVNFETERVPVFQNVSDRQSARQQEGLVNENRPNSSFQTKFITNAKQEQPKMASIQISNNFNRPQFSRNNSTQQFNKIEAISKQIKNYSQIQTTQAKLESETSQNKSFTQQFGKFPNQKIKIVSSGKNYSNSNKSHKSGSAKSSSEKTLALQTAKEVKTQPFAPIIESAQTQKPKDIIEVKEKCSPFKTIKQVKNSIVNPYKSPEVSLTNVTSNYSQITKFQPNTKQTSRKFIQRTKPIELQFNTQETQSKYVEPTYATKKITSNFQTNPYYTNEYLRNTPVSYAFPSHIQESNTPSYSVKTLKNSKQITNQYQLPTYAQKQFSNPKTFEFAPKYESKFATNISSSYQVCEKFDSILNLTKKEYPDSNKQNLAKPQEPTYSTTNQTMSKRSFLTQLDIKQSINMQQIGKKTVGFGHIQASVPKKIQVQVKEISSGWDNVIKKSLKQSINLQSSGQFKFDF